MTETVYRRQFIEGVGLAGLSAAVLAGDAARHLLDTPGSGLALGTPVIDTEATSPDRAIVVHHPLVSIRDWWVYGKTTVADHNPTYDPDEPVVLVAFLHHLFEGWEHLASSALFQAVCEHGVHFYAFPASRLTPA